MEKPKSSVIHPSATEDSFLLFLKKDSLSQDLLPLWQNYTQATSKISESQEYQNLTRFLTLFLEEIHGESLVEQLESFSHVEYVFYLPVHKKRLSQGLTLLPLPFVSLPLEALKALIKANTKSNECEQHLSVLLLYVDALNQQASFGSLGTGLLDALIEALTSTAMNAEVPLLLLVYLISQLILDGDNPWQRWLMTWDQSILLQSKERTISCLNDTQFNLLMSALQKLIFVDFETQSKRNLLTLMVHLLGNLLFLSSSKQRPLLIPLLTMLANKDFSSTDESASLKRFSFQFQWLLLHLLFVTNLLHQKEILFFDVLCDWMTWVADTDCFESNELSYFGLNVMPLSESFEVVPREMDFCFQFCYSCVVVSSSWTGSSSPLRKSTLWRRSVVVEPVEQNDLVLWPFFVFALKHITHEKGVFLFFDRLLNQINTGTTVHSTLPLTVESLLCLTEIVRLWQRNSHLFLKFYLKALEYVEWKPRYLRRLFRHDFEMEHWQNWTDWCTAHLQKEEQMKILFKVNYLKVLKRVPQTLKLCLLKQCIVWAGKQEWELIFTIHADSFIDLLVENSNFDFVQASLLLLQNKENDDLWPIWIKICLIVLNRLTKERQIFSMTFIESIHSILNQTRKLNIFTEIEKYFLLFSQRFHAVTCPTLDLFLLLQPTREMFYRFLLVTRDQIPDILSNVVEKIISFPELFSELFDLLKDEALLKSFATVLEEKLIATPIYLYFLLESELIEFCLNLPLESMRYFDVLLKKMFSAGPRDERIKKVLTFLMNSDFNLDRSLLGLEFVDALLQPAQQTPCWSLLREASKMRFDLAPSSNGFSLVSHLSFDQLTIQLDNDSVTSLFSMNLQKNITLQTGNKQIPLTLSPMLDENWLVLTFQPLKRLWPMNSGIHGMQITVFWNSNWIQSIKLEECFDWQHGVIQGIGKLNHFWIENTILSREQIQSVKKSKSLDFKLFQVARVRKNENLATLKEFGDASLMFPILMQWMKQGLNAVLFEHWLKILKKFPSLNNEQVSIFYMLLQQLDASFLTAFLVQFLVSFESPILFHPLIWQRASIPVQEFLLETVSPMNWHSHAPLNEKLFPHLLKLNQSHLESLLQVKDASFAGFCLIHEKLPVKVLLCFMKRFPDLIATCIELLPLEENLEALSLDVIVTWVGHCLVSARPISLSCYKAIQMKLREYRVLKLIQYWMQSVLGHNDLETTFLTDFMPLLKDLDLLQEMPRCLTWQRDLLILSETHTEAIQVFVQVLVSVMHWERKAWRLLENSLIFCENLNRKNILIQIMQSLLNALCETDEILENECIIGNGLHCVFLVHDWILKWKEIDFNELTCAVLEWTGKVSLIKLISFVDAQDSHNKLHWRPIAPCLLDILLLSHSYQHHALFKELLQHKDCLLMKSYFNERLLSLGESMAESESEKIVTSLIHPQYENKYAKAMKSFSSKLEKDQEQDMHLVQQCQSVLDSFNSEVSVSVSVQGDDAYNRYLELFTNKFSLTNTTPFSIP